MTDREVAHRLFSKEFNESVFDINNFYLKDESQRSAQNYMLSPLGRKINRVYVVGTVTEVDIFGTENNLIKARLVDSSGAFIIYSNIFEPQVTKILLDIEVPFFAAVVGKINAYSPDNDKILVSILPEVINEVDTKVRDNWIMSTVEFSLNRLNILSDIVSSNISDLNDEGKIPENTFNENELKYINLAIEKYNISSKYIKEFTKVVKKAIESIEITTTLKNSAENVIESLMIELDEGKGVVYSDLMEKAKSLGLSETAIDDAATALLSKGRCYEPKIGILRPI